MKGFRSRLTRFTGPTLALALVLSTAPAIAQTAVGTGAFPRVAEIAKQLKRGVSTRADVQRALGVPNGSGGALLPGYGERSAQTEAYQLWFYQDIEVTNFKSEQDIMKMNMRQQILAVFFKGEVFHGYFWTTNDTAAEARR